MKISQEIPELIESISPYYRKKRKPEEEHELTYDSSADGLEPVYFFMTDLMEFMGFKIEKLIDNFSSSPGSGHFGELGQRASIMQQQGSKILADMNTVLRSILNLIYDLREFKIRLKAYGDLKSPSTKEVAVLSLKQVWMDKVDMAKGNSSIKAMALGQAGFATLIDGFLAAKDVKQVDRIDLNDRVKRILKPRLLEFESWIKESQAELEKRYEIEKTYLKSQVSSLKLYSRWAKPYLKAAAQLESTDFGRDPALVKVFNTLLLELTLLGKMQLNIKEISQETTFPEHFAKEKFLKNLKRQYHICTFLNFKFRGIPNKVPGSQHYSFGGRVEMTFRAYSLNDDELAALYQKLDDDDLNSGLGLIKDITEDSLDQLKDDIEYFVGEGKEERGIDETASNPFSALFGKYEPKDSKPKQPKEEILEVKPDNWYEKEYFRKEAAKTAKVLTYKLLDVYKKAHDMPSFTSSY